MVSVAEASSYSIGVLYVLECGVATLSLVEELDLVKDRVRELGPGLPFLPVEQFEMHRRRKRLHYLVAQAIADGSERRQQTSGADLLAEGPRVELNRPGLVGVSIVWKRGWTHAKGHHPGEADDSSLQP